MLQNEAIRKAIKLGAKYYIIQHIEDGTIVSLEFVDSLTPRTITHEHYRGNPVECLNCVESVALYSVLTEDLQETKRPYSIDLISKYKYATKEIDLEWYAWWDEEDDK